MNASPTPFRVLITGSREYGADLIAPTGGKKAYRPDWTSVPSVQRDAMVQALRDARERANGRPLVVVHGDAAGADTLARMLAERSGCTVEAWPALWRREDGSTRSGYDRDEALRMRNVYTRTPGYNRTAGPERNQAMVDAGADLCLGFKAAGAGNRGTSHCLGIAEAAGIPTSFVEV